eukprot:56323-Eustigmatos_ZCMA.PRE.1
MTIKGVGMPATRVTSVPYVRSPHAWTRFHRGGSYPNKVFSHALGERSCGRPMKRDSRDVGPFDLHIRMSTGTSATKSIHRRPRQHSDHKNPA